MDDEKGLYKKYTVINNETGKEVTDFCFVLKPHSDPAAKKALLTYIENTHDIELADKLLLYIDDLF